MKTPLFLLIAIHLSLCNAQERQCFDALPGDEHIRFDSLDAVKITKLRISPKNDHAYIATEYFGAPNLQATVYLLNQGKYCSAGDLGPAVDFRPIRSSKGNDLYDIQVESISGDTKFYRVFAFNRKTQTYGLHSCKLVVNSVRRPCTPNERSAF